MKRQQKKISKREKEFLSISPGHATGVTVIDGDIKYALKIFKRKVKQSGKMKDYYDRREFKKPSMKRREVILSAKYRNKKAMEAEE